MASRPSLNELQSGANFIPRHIGPRADEIATMLKQVGASSLEDLVHKVIPPKIRSSTPLALPEPLSERNALSELRLIADRNKAYTSMIGMGYYGTRHAQGDPAQRPGKSRLVHGLHALPGRK